MEVAQSPQVQRQIAHGIRHDLIDKMQEELGLSPMNPLRAMKILYQRMTSAMKEKGLDQIYSPYDLTIGGIDGRSFGKCRNGEADPEEAEYADLDILMGLNPHGNVAQELAQKVLDIQMEYWDNPDSPALANYDPQAAGLKETRIQYIKSLSKHGFTTKIPFEGTFMSDGGMEGLQRVAGTLVATIRRERQKNQDSNTTVELGFPVPGFVVAANAESFVGATPRFLPTSQKNKYCFEPGEITKILRDNPCMGILQITPFNNPTTLAWKPEEMKRFLAEAKAERPNIKIIFDMAYFELVSKDFAADTIKAIEDAGMMDSSVFVFSHSKAFGQPRLRSGMIVATNPVIAKAISDHTLSTRSSQSWPVDLLDLALMRHFEEHPEILKSYRDLLLKRKRVLLECIIRFNQKRIEAGKDQIFDPDYLAAIQESDFNDEVPLYLWVKGDAWRLAKELGVIAAPGVVFGEEGMVRLSVGTSSCSDIRKAFEID